MEKQGILELIHAFDKLEEAKEYFLKSSPGGLCNYEIRWNGELLVKDELLAQMKSKVNEIIETHEVLLEME